VAGNGFVLLEVAVPFLLKSDQLKAGRLRVGVIIGMDPHKRSATIEVVDERGRGLATGRYGTDKVGYAGMLHPGREQPDRPRSPTA
jgi:hypothetical protein